MANQRRTLGRFSLPPPTITGRPWEEAVREIQKWMEVATSILDSGGTLEDVTDHQVLNNLQGGTLAERYHFTLAQHAYLSVHQAAVDPHPLYINAAELAAAIAAHEAAGDPHPTYMTSAEVDASIAAALAAHVALSDPHPQYIRVINRGGTFVSPSGALALVIWRAPFACTVTNVRGYRRGGTGATINAQRNGSSTHLSSDLSLTSADTWMDGGAVQNTAYAAGDSLELLLQSVAGGPTQVAIQVELVRA